MKEDPWHSARYLDELQGHPVYSVEAGLDHSFPGRPTIVLPVEKSRIRFNALSNTAAPAVLDGFPPKPTQQLLDQGWVVTLSVEKTSYSHAMSPSAHARRLFPLLSRDYIRRRRAVRRIANALLIAVLSFVAAYFITRSTGGTGFPARKATAKTEVAPAAAVHPPADAPPAAPVPASTDVSGYELEPGPHTVSEVEDLVLHDAKRDKDLHVR